MLLTLSFVSSSSIYATDIDTPAVSPSASSLVTPTVSYGSVSISTNGSVAVEILPSSTGSLAVAADNIAVSTSTGASWQLYVSGELADPSGYSALYLDGDRSSSAKFAAIPVSTPSTFTAKNQWGIAVPSYTSGGYYYLLSTKHAANQNTIMQAPLSFPRSGYYYWQPAALKYYGTNGSYWSSTAQATTDAFHVDFHSSACYPGTYYSHKGYGISVRCALIGS